MNAFRLFALMLLLQVFCSAQKTVTYTAHYLEPFRGPQVYKDAKSGTLIYVESDGRHMAAISPDGKLLWHRDPFQDAHLPVYRVKNPQVIYMGPVEKTYSVDKGEPDEFVAVSLTNSQFGLVRISTGEFQFHGQD